MAYKSDNFMFRDLTDAEEEQFRQYAREHDPDLSKWEIFHPICRDEWEKLGKGPKKEFGYPAEYYMDQHNRLFE